jgi:hypothetical protein
MLVFDEQQGFGGSGSKQWILAAFIDFFSSGDSQSPLSARISRDPATEPDPRKWRTEIAYLVEDSKH